MFAFLDYAPCASGSDQVTENVVKIDDWPVLDKLFDMMSSQIVCDIYQRVVIILYALYMIELSGTVAYWTQAHTNAYHNYNTRTLDEDASLCAEPGAVLVLNTTTRAASCLRLPCPEKQVLLADGRCHEKWTVCAGRQNIELVLLETGLGACDCRDGHVFWPADGRCHPVFARGPFAR